MPGLPLPPRQLVLLGGGGHALVVQEAAYSAGVEVVGVFDDDPKCTLAARTRTPCVGTLASLDAGRLQGDEETGWIIAIGGLATRRTLIGRLAAAGVSNGFVPIAALKSHVSPTCTLGAGAFVGPLACVHSFARVGAHAIVNTGAIVEHECVLGENVHVAPNATLGGNVTVGADTLIGIGATVLPGVRIGAGCTIGAGAVVRRDVADGARVVGVPAR